MAHAHAPASVLSVLLPGSSARSKSPDRLPGTAGALDRSSGVNGGRNSAAAVVAAAADSVDALRAKGVFIAVATDVAVAVVVVAAAAATASAAPVSPMIAFVPTPIAMLTGEVEADFDRGE